MASDAHWNKRIKFVKVNSDELKALAKDLKATALPYIVLHRPKLGTEVRPRSHVCTCICIYIFYSWFHSTFYF